MGSGNKRGGEYGISLKDESYRIWSWSDVFYMECGV